VVESLARLETVVVGITASVLIPSIEKRSLKMRAAFS